MTDEDRRRGLRQMRRLALALLVAAALVYLAVTIFTDGQGVWGFVQTASEAAMIGGLADWFAVTALFRHPLGLKIPHTAIIPTRKDALGVSLSGFVAENFLNAEIVSDKIVRARLAARVGGWLAEEAHRDAVLDGGARLALKGLDAVSRRDVRDVLDSTVVPRLVELDKAPLLGSVLADIVQADAHRPFVDFVLTEAHVWISGADDVFERLVTSRTPSWLPRWASESLAARLHREVIGWVAEARDRPDHAARVSFDGWLAQLAADLQSDPGTRERAEALLNRLIEREGVTDAALAVWDSLVETVRESLGDPAGVVRGKLADALDALGRRLRDDEPFARGVDERVARIVGSAADAFGGEVATVISDTIERWDGVEAAEKIELHVGRDLQYIRINGTVVGAVVGLVIHAVTLALPRLG